MNYRDQNPISFAARADAAPMDAGLRAFMLHVYNLMASALVLTGLTAYAGATWQPLKDALYTMQEGHLGLTGLGWLVLFAPLAFVFLLSAGINRMSLAAAQGTFWAYSAIMGLSLSSIFFVYTGESLVRVFFITAIMFGSMSIWGYSTKRDLTGMGHFMIMGLFGIIIASIINIFLHSSGLQFLVSVIGVVVFTGLTAYDTQKIKQFYYQVAGGADMVAKYAIMGALTLYLDFINLFMMLLRFMGDRRN